MHNLFHIPNHTISTDNYSHYLHGNNVTEFEKRFAKYVGAKYAVGVNSATTAIFLMLYDYKNHTINVPSMIPPVVLNAVITSGNKVNFTDNVDWVGSCYLLHEFTKYKIWDSAQQVDRAQFSNIADDNDLMFFSFYPTKPVGSSDGGMIVSNDKDKIDWLRTLAYNGMSLEKNNWDRKIIVPGYKMYLSSIQADIANRNLDLLDAKQERLGEIRTKYNLSFRQTNVSNHLYRLYVEDREDFIAKMKDCGIECGIHYASMHKMYVYNRGVKYSCPKSEDVSTHTVSIPFHEKLTDKDTDYIIKCVNKFGFQR